MFYDVQQTTQHHPCSPPPLTSNPAVVSSFPEPAIELPSPTDHCCKPDRAHNPIRKREVPTTTRAHSVRPLAHNFDRFCFPSVVPTPKTLYIRFLYCVKKRKSPFGIHRHHHLLPSAQAHASAPLVVVTSAAVAADTVSIRTGGKGTWKQVGTSQEHCRNWNTLPVM